MPVAVSCRCGRTYQLKDEFAGKIVQCPHCAEKIRAPKLLEEFVQAQADPVFDRDKFLLRQKHLAISEKYVVWGEQGQPILFIERPAHLGRGLLAALAGIFAGLVFGAVFGVLAAVIPFEPVQVALAIVAVVGGIATLFVVMISLSPKRHVTFYRDESKQDPVLQILQDKKWQILIATFTVTDMSGQVLARLRKNHLSNFIRKQWLCYAPDGSVLCVIKEDSMILALLRRFIGPLLGILRTNFIILAAPTKNVIGEFNRNYTILDRYVLDMTADPKRTLDRRIALAIGVMLDTGERR